MLGRVLSTLTEIDFTYKVWAKTKAPSFTYKSVYKITSMSILNFSHQQCPRCKVKRCSSCLFGKQMRQTSAAAAIRLFKALLWYCCTCTALRVLRYASQFVTLLAAHTAFVTAAPVSFMPPHSFRASFRSITPRS
jgi:hypothetical protein